MPNDWISGAFDLTLPLMGVKIGDPKTAGERLLRQAVAEEPAHYWSHFWLGWCLVGQLDVKGAELAFTTCTSLRPEEGLAYAERARILAYSASRMPAGVDRDGMIRRFEADADRAKRFAPTDWYVQHPLMHSYVLLGRQKEALATASRMLELVPPPHVLQSRLRDEQEQTLKNIVAMIDFAKPEDPAEIASIKAVVSVLLKKDGEALQLADVVAATKPSHPRVRLVRGIVHLRKKELPAAATEFEAAIAGAPKCFLARSGLARTLELRGKHTEALTGYEGLVASAETDDQRLGAYLGCVRNLQRVGRSDDARKARAKARARDPKATTK
jgi:tetratricopeptide (TPR) repeat protein